MTAAQTFFHDVEAPTADGFTYRMLYLDPQWLPRELNAVFDSAPDNGELSFANTLACDSRLAQATSLAFETLHGGELKIARGEQPATVAVEPGFADQSHSGCWFMRAYGLG
ncbi:hypothetical protein D3C84_511580 [compost metagenome]